jgi:sugar lactone lactonase YvrE
MRKSIYLSIYLSICVCLTTNAQAPNISYTGSPFTFTTGSAITPLTPTNSGGAVPATTPGTVTTFAGNGMQGSTEGTGTAAMFNYPYGVAVDAAGNVYVADSYNHKIRKISSVAVVTTLAGNGTLGSNDATGTLAKFNYPLGVAVDAAGNVYVADIYNNKIRKITSTGVVTTLAGSSSTGAIDGIGTAASFNNPTGVAVDATGNVYVADNSNHKIRKITSAGVVTTLAGNGTAGAIDGIGTAASFNFPTGVAVDAAGNVYVADNINQKIRKITSAGVVSTLAGSGTYGSTDATGTAASFYNPNGVAVDATGNVYVADNNNQKIRKITSAGVVTTLAGNGTVGATDAIGTAASFYDPTGVAVDAAGNVYVADYSNHKIRKISLFGYSISPTLPTGLSFNATTGTISGTPTVVTAATNYSITATNSSGISSTVISIATTTTTPVVLNSFILEKNARTAILNWSTASEINNKYFEVQRSIDSKTFSTIGIVEAKGFAGEYLFKDENPFVGINYYRLKQVDIDGKFSFSETKSVKFDGDGKLSFVMYPNPAKEKVNVYANAFFGKGEIIITDISGKQIQQQVLVVGNNTIEIKNLTKGIYFVNIVTEKEKQTQKLVVE